MGGILIGAGLLSELLGQAVKSGVLEAAGNTMQDMGNNLIDSFEEAVKSEHVSSTKKGTIVPADATSVNSMNPLPPDFDKGYKPSKSSQKDRTQGLKNEIDVHKQKLNDYMEDPLKHDNKGYLKKALAEGNFNRYNQIYNNRIKSLQNQIKNFESQLNKIGK